MKSLYPVSQLRERYGIGKQAEINRRKHLGIKPTKIEGVYYVNQEQLDLLDSLDRYLKETGGKMSDFDPSLAVDSLDSTDGLTTLDPVESTPVKYQEATLIDSKQINSEWEPLIEILAKKLQPIQSPLKNWRELEEACSNGWLLTTKQVQALAGVKPQGAQWVRGSFLFTKAGKIGNQTAWSVQKVSVVD